jgi:hypothetical protein
MTHLSSPRRLSSFRRFDVFIKVLFSVYPDLRVCGVTTEYLYKHHLRIWNGFFESEPPRRSFQDFQKGFASIISADGPLALPPVSLSANSDLLNGSHRLANALAKSWPLSVNSHNPEPGQDHVTLKYLVSRGFLQHLPRSIINFLTLFALSVSRQQSLIILWDTSYLYPLLETLSDCSLRPVFYATSSVPSSQLSDQVLANLVRLIYCDNDWLFDSTGAPFGSFSKARQVSSHNPIGLLLVESDQKHNLESNLYDKVTAAKLAFRTRTSTAHSVLHSADSFAESWAVLSTLLNSTSSFSTLSRLASPQARGFFSLNGIPDLLDSIDHYWRFVLTSTSAMQAYGLDIAPRDLDLICHHSSSLLPIYGHTSEQAFYLLTQDELSSNLSYSYHHMGVRVLKPSIVYSFKSNRNEPKDRQHLQILGPMMSARHDPPLAFIPII